MNYKGKKITVIGAGRSGLAAAEVVKSLGAFPFISDSFPIKDKSILEKLASLDIHSESGGHTSAALNCDLMVVSPGVSADAPILVQARQNGIIIWPEIELAYRLCRGKIVGITGSNGKTTTTALLGEICIASGRPTVVAGNIGTPFSQVARKVADDGLVVARVESVDFEPVALDEVSRVFPSAARDVQHPRSPVRARLRRVRDARARSIRARR